MEVKYDVTESFSVGHAGDAGRLTGSRMQEDSARPGNVSAGRLYADSNIGRG